MFGVYSNKRISENERKILYEEPDDYTWYLVILSKVFNEHRFFNVREDIKIPQREEDDGVVLMFKGGEPVYFKTLDGDVTDDEFNSIMKVCNFLENKFNCPIKSYVLCKPGFEIKIDEISEEGDVKVYFSAFDNHDGEKIIDRLETKLKDNKEFEISDSIEHMFLPYSGYKNKKVFEEKLEDYMNLVKTYNLE